MDVIAGAAGFRTTTDAWRADGHDVGLAPTLGALHAGHASLFGRAREERARLAVTIFVNPLQFGPTEDFANYPRPTEVDLEMCERGGADVVWMPPVDEVFPPGTELPSPDPGPVGETFEGRSRPGHFAGVLKVVHRLLDVAGAATAYFGEKDAQQLFLIRRMVVEQNLPVQIVACSTVRDTDGLALSTRNGYLSANEREQAGCLFLGLAEAAGLARAGERDARVLVAAMAREIGATELARLDYAAVVDEATFEAVTTIDGPARAIVAARFPSARLIDNLALPEPVPT